MRACKTRAFASSNEDGVARMKDTTVEKAAVTLLREAIKTPLVCLYFTVESIAPHASSMPLLEPRLPFLPYFGRIQRWNIPVCLCSL